MHENRISFDVIMTSFLLFSKPRENNLCKGKQLCCFRLWKTRDSDHLVILQVLNLPLAKLTPNWQNCLWPWPAPKTLNHTCQYLQEADPSLSVLIIFLSNEITTKQQNFNQWNNRSIVWSLTREAKVSYYKTVILSLQIDCTFQNI